MKHLSILLILGALLSFCGKKTGQAPGQTTLKAAITFINGQVELERSGTREPAAVGAVLAPTDVVITGAGASAEMMMKGFGIVKIGADSRIRVISLVEGGSGSTAEIKLERGDLASFIKKKQTGDNYSVVTPTAIAGVRGTSFLTSVERLPEGSDKTPQVQLAVLEGAVAVRMPGQEEVIITQNSQLVINGFQKISRDMIRGLSAENLKAIKQMAVFHKANVLEFNSLVADIQSSSAELQMLESDASVDSAMDARSDRQARMADDSVQRARKADDAKYLKRDTEGDPIKLKPASSYKE